METDSLDEVYELIDTLQQATKLVESLHQHLGVTQDKQTNQLLDKLQRGVNNLTQFVESQQIQFGAKEGRFIDRESEARPLRTEFKAWAANIFRAGVIRRMGPLYVSTSQVDKLLERTNRGDDNYLEITLGKSKGELCVMMAAVTGEGVRLDDPDALTGGGEDVLDDMFPCPPHTNCPPDLDQ
jgi:polyphosphate kinase